MDACMQEKTRLLLIKCIYEELVEVYNERGFGSGEGEGE